MNEHAVFDFDEIPSELRRFVLEKFDYNQYVCFTRLSKLSHEVAEAHSGLFKFPLYTREIRMDWKNGQLQVNMEISPGHFKWIDVTSVNQANLRWIIAQKSLVKDRLNNEKCIQILNAIIANKIRCDSLVFLRIPECDLLNLKKVIEIVKCLDVSLGKYSEIYGDDDDVEMSFDTDFLPDNIRKLAVEGPATLTNTQLLLLKCKYMHFGFCKVTAEGINQFLEQWKNKEREITFCSLICSNPWDLEGLQDIMWLTDDWDKGRVERDDGEILKISLVDERIEIWKAEPEDVQEREEERESEN